MWQWRHASVTPVLPPVGQVPRSVSAIFREHRRAAALCAQQTDRWKVTTEVTFTGRESSASGGRQGPYWLRLSGRFRLGIMAPSAIASVGRGGSWPWNRPKLVSVKGKGKGLGTCYSAAYETRTAALYNLGSGSWLAWGRWKGRTWNCRTCKGKAEN